MTLNKTYIKESSNGDDETQTKLVLTFLFIIILVKLCDLHIKFQWDSDQFVILQ